MRMGLMTAGLDDTAPEGPAANCRGDLIRPGDVSYDDGRKIWKASSTGIALSSRSAEAWPMSSLRCVSLMSATNMRGIVRAPER
jgi:hypothetical protein